MLQCRAKRASVRHAVGRVVEVEVKEVVRLRRQVLFGSLGVYVPVVSLRLIMRFYN